MSFLNHLSLADYIDKRIKSETLGFADPVQEYLFYTESLQCVGHATMHAFHTWQGGRAEALVADEGYRGY